MKRELGSDLADHYLGGGRDLAEAQRELAATAAVLDRKPVPVRPFFDEATGLLEFELEMRRGPRWRCSGCGYHDARAAKDSYRANEQPCGNCGEMKVQRYTGGARPWPPAMEGRERDWALAMAARLGVPLVTTEEAPLKEGRTCRKCGEKYKLLFE